MEKPVDNVDNFCEKPVEPLWKENLCSANKCADMFHHHKIPPPLPVIFGFRVRSGKSPEPLQ